MPVFKYTALDLKGKTTAGIIDADSSLVASQKLRQSDIYPVSIHEVKKNTPPKKAVYSAFTQRFSKIKSSEIAMMTRQLATLVNAGFQLVAAMDSLLGQTKSAAFKTVLARIKDSIVEGNSFAAALSQHPNLFSTLYLNMVRAGESSGTLEIVLERLADTTEKQQALKRRIQTALAYPLLMSALGILVLFFLMTVIVPTITGIFEDMNQVLPGPTRFLISISSVFKVWWWVFLIALIVMVFVGRGLKKTIKGRYFWDKTKLVLPGVRTITTKLAVARFARTLGSLLENGVTMLTALDIVKNISNNVLIADVIEKAVKSVGQGQSVAVALNDGQIFPDLFIQMVQVGEQSGELEEMLAKIADVFENEAESTIMSITSLLEPLMILVMGVVVGFIVLSICLPIFEMNQLVR